MVAGGTAAKEVRRKCPFEPGLVFRQASRVAAEKPYSGLNRRRELMPRFSPVSAAAPSPNVILSDAAEKSRFPACFPA